MLTRNRRAAMLVTNHVLPVVMLLRAGAKRRVSGR
jgi:hypothetical protein